MKVMLNASALSGTIVFTVSNIMGMNLGSAPDRLAGNAGFSGSTFMGYPVFLLVSMQHGSSLHTSCGYVFLQPSVCSPQPSAFVSREPLQLLCDTLHCKAMVSSPCMKLSVLPVQVTIFTWGASVLIYMGFLLYLHLVKLGPSNITS
jgi:hypothetical protein